MTARRRPVALTGGAATTAVEPGEPGGGAGRSGEPGGGGARSGEPHPAAARTRMGIALLSLLGLFVAGYMLLYATGVIGGVLCGPQGACDVVQASPYAVFLGVPVPLWGVLGYGLLFLTALVGVQPGRARDRRIGAALLALGGGAFLFSAYLTALEAFVIGAWCRWCVVSAVLATLIFALSLAELPRPRRG